MMPLTNESAQLQHCGQETLPEAIVGRIFSDSIEAGCELLHNKDDRDYTLTEGLSAMYWYMSEWSRDTDS